MLIGLFGGTFDPPHLGHLALCRAAFDQLGLQRLLWVLTPDPPHKQGLPITPQSHRLAMVNLAIQGTSFELSRVELDRPAPHYALDTVKIMAEQNPGADLIYLMGSDSLNDLPSWRRPADLVSALHSIGVMLRPGETPDLPALEGLIPGLTAKVCFVEAPLVDISASDIRRRARAGEPFSDLVPPGVAAYIRKHRLYQSPNRQS
ncbi:MAG: nicotinate (nicotinamide) nucleotide adenylyltransferase [Chloroflexi bacterium]|nr:nicotinate (nicotinamide) nucleotide adenylyltransferase [Chloroflexota bacterium]